MKEKTRKDGRKKGNDERKRGKNEKNSYILNKSEKIKGVQTIVLKSRSVFKVRRRGFHTLPQIFKV